MIEFRHYAGCFGSALNPSFEDLIEKYRVTYEAVEEYCNDVLDGISIGLPWKVHIIVCHLKQWLANHSEGMSRYSEQAAESTHHDFDKTWKRFKRDESHKDHGKNLRRAAVEYSLRRL